MTAQNYHRRPKAHPVIGTLFLLLLAGVGFLAWRGWPAVVSPAGGLWRGKGGWGSERINIAIAGKQMALFSVNTKNSSAVVVKIPQNLYLPNLIHGYGQYPAGSVYQVGQIDKRGGEVLAGTIQEFLGAPVDGYYYSLQSLTDPKSFFVSLDFLLGKNSDLSLFQKIELLKSVWKLRFDKIKTVDLEARANSLVLADGSSALFLEPAEVDQTLEGLLIENILQSEDLRVEVINTTPVVGLAARVGRLLANLGLTVVNLDGSAQMINQCKVAATKKVLKSQTVVRLAQIYNCVKEEKPEEGRAAVSVYLGTDYADWLAK
jgi:hypothetical protein